MTDWLRYIASYPDLVAALGDDPAAGQRHFEQYGQAEGRSVAGFDPLFYGASNPDVALAFGADEVALERHYIRYGFREERPLAGFDALRYAASNPDVARAFGSDVAALARHYLRYGVREGRALASFDALDYAALNSDLVHAFGTDAAALTRHYIQFGLGEGRAVTGFDAVGYLLANADLGAAGLGAAGARDHWLHYGLDEGRTLNPFGSDQIQHQAAVGRVATGSFETGGDRDWYSIGVAAGEKVALAVLRPDLAGALLGGAGVQVFDAAGHPLQALTMAGEGFDHWLSFAAPAAGTYYVAVAANGATGAYQIGVARVAADPHPGDPFGGFYTGDALANVYLGGNGYSHFQGAGGDDILGGGAGQDDFLGSPGADYMDGGSLFGADGTSASDSIDYRYSPSAVTAYLDGRLGVGGDAQGDRLVSVEQLYGSAFADRLYGSTDANVVLGDRGDDVIHGLDGDDVLLAGGDGNDLVYGDAGNDRLAGDAGSDRLDGGSGFDTADYQNADAPVRVDLRSGAVGGGAAGDTLVSIEAVVGTYGGDDVLATAAATDRAGSTLYQQLLGGGGDDILIDRADPTLPSFLVGDVGDDLLVGARLEGYDGDDVLVAFSERVINVASGGQGADVYVVETGRHLVSGAFDFSLDLDSFDAGDRIDLSQLRDEGGQLLDLPDIRAHAHGNLIDLSGLRTAAGDLVIGSIQLEQRASMFDPAIPYDTAALIAANFIFAGGIDWQARVPADFPIF